jgi:predicted HicB family RNase H-like nuclease
MPPVATQQQELLYPMLVRVPRELHTEAKQRASDEDRTLAQVVRRALRQYLAEPQR